MAEAREYIPSLKMNTFLFPGRHIIREGRDRYKICLPKSYNHILEELEAGRWT